MRNHLLLTVALTIGLLCAGQVSAQSTQRTAGLASSGLCGLSSTAAPICPEQVSVSATGSYGYTESIGAVPGAHHRIGGTLGLGVVPLPWLAVALRLDGRLDLHPADMRGDDLTGTGDPRLLLRAGHRLSPTLSLGGEAALWFPGTDAPSFEPKATTVDLKTLLAWQPRDVPLTLLANAGFRIDQSANSAPDVRRLRAGDRIALGLSDSHAVLLAVGLATQALANSELFGELSVDWLVGGDAPSFSKSPLRATLGARRFFSRGLQGELSTTVALSSRPDTAVTAPLVPIEPRFLLSLGLRYGYDLRKPVEQPPAVQEEVKVEPAAPVLVRVSGVLVDEANAPLPDVRVSLRSGTVEREAITDGEGRYTFVDVPLGEAALEATARGFETQKWTLEVGSDTPEAKRPMVARGNVGSIRVLTRTFASEPLPANILVRDTRGKKVAEGNANEQGLFEVDLPPGRYVMTIAAKGYRPLRREVQVERFGVAILNVDMREEK